MTHREFLEWLRRIERDYPVLEWRVAGLRIWPMARLIIYGANFHARSERYSLGQSPSGYARLATQAIAAWTTASLRDRVNSVRPHARSDAVFLTASVGRQPMVEGTRYNPRVAPYAEMLARRGFSSLVWEMSPYADYNIPRHTPSAFIQPILLWSRLRSQAQPGIRFAETLPNWEDFLGDVRSAGFEFRYAERERLHRDVFYIRLLAHQFSQWLGRVSPRIAFVSDASAAELAMCLACRARGLPVIEIQHGVQGEMHPTYSGWTAVPSDGFSMRPRAWWSWDDESASAIMEWAAKIPNFHTAIVGGDPWREMWLAGTNDVARRALTEVREKVSAVGGDKHILVTLSSNREILPTSVLDALHQSAPGWRWWFRMHPVNLEQREPETAALLNSVGQDAGRMRWATEVPLYPLLQAMDCHITVGLSTVVQESAAVGVPSIGCMSEAFDFYAAEVARGMMRVALTGDAMLADLELFLKRPKQSLSDLRPDPEKAMDEILELRAVRETSA